MIKQMYFFFLNSERMEELNSLIGTELHASITDTARKGIKEVTGRYS